MTDPGQMLGTAITVPVGGLALPWSAVVVCSSAHTQPISGTATLTAGTYEPLRFINHAAKKLRTSIYDAIVAQAWFSIKPANAAAVPLKIDIQSGGAVPGVGTTVLRIQCASTGGALHSGHSTSWQSFTLENAPISNWAWLGLARPGEDRALTIAAGGFADNGRFQPRWLFCLRAYFRDSGDLRRWPGHNTDVYDDGTVAQHSIGTRNLFDRTLVLVDQPQHIVGVRWEVGVFDDFGVSRNLLELQTLDETLFIDTTNAHKRTTNLITPAYVWCNNWWARYYQESPTDTFACFDVWPDAVEPAVGEMIFGMPESEALVEEIRRTGLLFRYVPNDADGTTSKLAGAYALATGANPRPQRRGNGNLFYSLEIPLVWVPNPELAVP
jgi:hypothetical protein